MGTKIIEKALRRRSAGIVITGAILLLLTGFLALAFILVEGIDGLSIFFLVLAALSLWLVIAGVRQGSVKTNGIIKRNPDILAQSEELYANIQYQDKYIVFSEKHIASMKNPLSIAAFDEVLGMHESTTRVYFFITVHRELTIVTKKGSVSIPAGSSKNIQELIRIIAPHCPDARLGYSPDNAAYYSEEQQMYKGNMVRK